MASSGEPRVRTAADVRTYLSNAVTTFRNTLAKLLPGERPSWLVLELSGSYPARKVKRKFLARALGMSERPSSQEEFEAQVSSLLRADWLTGVVLRVGDLSADLASAYAVRNQLLRLRAGGKRVVVVATNLGNTSYFLASAADRLIAPESAEFFVNGMSLGATFMADALERFGVRFDKLAIKEYKNAGDQFVLPAMSEAQREQYDALLHSFQTSTGEAIAASRSTSAEAVKGWVDEGVTSAAQAQRRGMIDQVAYEDQVMSKQHRPYAAGARFIPGVRRPAGGRHVAVVSLVGNIVPGKSRKLPIPLPLFGDALAGSDTLVRALRAAAKNERTAALVFHVDSGGGSALASDLIWREVKLLAEKMPVVAVMGQLAASGGYYVLTHATEVIAAPTTITGSIGVVMAKAVLEEFNDKHGFNPESVKRGRYAEIMSSARGFDEQERELLARYMGEIYQRFVARVADGRGLSEERVNEIGRGRIWSGADAVQLGLVDRLGDVSAAIARAKELAGLRPDAPSWNVPAPHSYLPPNAAEPSTLLRTVGKLFNERALLMHGIPVNIR
ncbi:MAG TPA: signal peptide peptidase SppA [Trueperaceae bacterium]|nr:signal peptide peptidase SppA [Trueperaceae bacterium]